MTNPNVDRASPVTLKKKTAKPKASKKA